MTEQEAIERMVAPGTRRKGKYREGVIQIWVTRACDKACYNCTQGSNLGGKPGMITPEQFEQAVVSLKGYYGVVGVFGGNPATHPQFELLCEILRRHIPFEHRGLWCNNPLGKGKVMRKTFDPSISNLNVHLDEAAYAEFKRDWPESRPFGAKDDSRHSPVFVAMRDVLKKPCPDCEGRGWNHAPPVEQQEAEAAAGKRTWATKIRCLCQGGQVYDESTAWELISNCDINKHWSAMIGVFRGELRAWFCEIAGAMSMLHQDEPDYPDTGLPITLAEENAKAISLERDVSITFGPGGKRWWELPMHAFTEQVRHHCHDCGVPMRGYGEMAQAFDGVEQTSATHRSIYNPKTRGRRVELVTLRDQVKQNALPRFTDYMGNAKR